MSRRKEVCIYAAVLIVFSCFVNQAPFAEYDFAKSGVTVETQRAVATNPHSPINIDGDTNFSATASAEGWSGDGSAQYPFIIENYDITMGPTPEASISIRNTRVNYTVRGCNLFGPAATPSFGIYLENSTNGRIFNNLITNFAHGLNVSGGCSNIAVIGNNISYNSYSIWCEDSDHLTITENHCSHNFFIGISLSNLDNGIISGNNVISNSAYGLNITGGSRNLLVTGNNISYNSYGIWCEDSTHLTITQNHCSNNSITGIYLSNSNNSTISGNSCIGNGENGIHLDHWSQFNLLTENICNENSQCGFRLQAAINNIFENNTSNENNYGIWTTASNDNPIHWNIFANNTDNIQDDGVNLDWDYNYWSDYAGSDANSDGFGDTSYTFGWYDAYPLMFPPFPVEWAQLITNQYVEFGSYFDYNIVINCPAPYVVCVNDTTNFWTGVPTISSSTTLAVGDYPLLANVTNIYGYYTEAIFTVFVRDTTPPIITSPDDFSFMVGEEYQTIEWHAQDLSPLSYVVLKNGSEVSSYSSTLTSIHFSMTLENYKAGIFNYTMVVTDAFGNAVFDTVIVTIMPRPFLEVMLPWLIAGALGIVVVIVLVVMIGKRRK